MNVANDCRNRILSILDSPQDIFSSNEYYIFLYCLAVLFLIAIVFVPILLVRKKESDLDKRMGWKKQKSNSTRMASQNQYPKKKPTIVIKRVLSPEEKTKLEVMYQKSFNELTRDDCIYMLYHDEHHNEFCNKQYCMHNMKYILAFGAISHYYGEKFGKYGCLHCDTENDLHDEKSLLIIYRSQTFVTNAPDKYSGVGKHPERWILLCEDCYYRNLDNEYLFDCSFMSSRDSVVPRKPGQKPKYKPYRMMSPREFEEFVSFVFRSRGYKTELIGGSGDDGIDIIVNRGHVKGIVQCKRYENNITPRMVREFAGAMSADNAEEAYFVTSGDFSENAKKWALNTRIMLINGETLHEWWADS